jgi:isopentenyldiphosphate isomerase
MRGGKMISLLTMKRMITVTTTASTVFHCAISFERSLAFSIGRRVVGQIPSRQSSFIFRNQYISTTTTAAAASSSQINSIIIDGVDKENEAVRVTDEQEREQEQVLKDMLYRIRECNKMNDDVRSSIVEFQVDGLVLGKVHPQMVELLCSTTSICIDDDERDKNNEQDDDINVNIDKDRDIYSSTSLSTSSPVFELVSTPPSSSSSSSFRPFLTLSEKVAGTTIESRTKAVAAVMEELKMNGIVTGWRDELYSVSDSFYNPPVFLMERAAISILGVLEYGVHINGIVLDQSEYNENDNDGNINKKLMWMARRSKLKSKYPGMVDHIVAGGQPAGLSLMGNVIKECEEEAGIPPEIAKPNIYPAGVVSYETVGNNGNGNKISRVVLFNYDLYLPKDYIPKPVDGEVEEFFLWDYNQIRESLSPDFNDPMKPNCYLVIIDYLLRERNYISPETKGYLDVIRELRSGDCR